MTLNKAKWLGLGVLFLTLVLGSAKTAWAEEKKAEEKKTEEKKTEEKKPEEKKVDTKATANVKVDTTKLKDGLYVLFDTTKGEILVELYYEKAPLTVTNFVGLVEGTKDFSNRPAGKPYYDGLKFHRVVSNFMIQGGCPSGNGTGGPGYQFKDEFDNSLTHDGEGILSMANAGPDTNGSQFFITHTATPFLNNKHSVFGKVVANMNVVNSIVQDDVINKLTIIRVGKKAKEFKSNQKAFDDLLKKANKADKEAESLTIEKVLKDKYPKASVITTKSGLKYIVQAKGNGAKPTKGQTIQAHYTGTLLSGKKFDSSVDRKEPFEFQVGMKSVIAGWDEAFLDMSVGEKRVLFIPSDLAYGDNGIPQVIPPKSWLIFDVELLKILK